MYQQGCSLCYTVSRLNGDPSDLRDSHKVTQATVPLTLLRLQDMGEPDDWTSLLRGRWRNDGHNTLSEGRALIR